jgi:SAM-dependent methyltransferase
MGEISASADRSGTGRGDPGTANASYYESTDLVEAYSRLGLRPVEALLLDRYRDALTGRVLEVGCGSGRLTRPLLAVAGEVHGIDISEAMVAHCRRELPEGRFERRDMREVGTHPAGPFDALIAPFNVLDALGESDRRRTLAGFHRVIAAGGLLIMSSHNRAFDPPGPIGEIVSRARARSLRGVAAGITHLPRRLPNRRRLQSEEVERPGYTIRNDVAHDFALLHYYILRDDQESQLSEHGFDLLECVDLDGRPVPRGAAAAKCPELHYVARRES